ncbi:hypothetical protein PRZ48_013893 [Zasmidium cellare]|uniref:Uncharacterized protein n=1 Tax=Zasmidium cellare TaxID=395010 RepID=A0ABR0DZH1_ZASCE|nr:hypothetical protein PRZ48_013893 [Zasmidium cellare]
MASPYIIRTIATFCNALPSTQYTAMISVDIELARSLAILEDGLHLQDPSLAGVVDTSVADIDAVKKRWQSAWNVDAELEFLTAKLYLYGIRLAGLLTEADVDNALYVDTLQASLHGAVKMATLTTDLNLEALFNAQNYGFHKNQHPLPGHGKHRVRSTFFAGVILLKYLDDTHQGTDDDKDLARNAFGKIFQMFSTSTSTNMAEIENAARILETAGRALRQGGGHLQPRVTTRMGASLVDNVSGAELILDKAVG